MPRTKYHTITVQLNEALKEQAAEIKKRGETISRLRKHGGKGIEAVSKENEALSKEIGVLNTKVYDLEYKNVKLRADLVVSKADLKSTIEG